VPERCTCGAQLPDDALFCHKCGKPQRDLIEPEPVVESVVEAPPPIPVSAPTPLPNIGFRNGQVVRIALLAGFLSILIWLIGAGIAPALLPLWTILGGMLTAFLYKLITKQRLSAIAGARLGWISGIFGFSIIALIMMTFAILLNNPANLSVIHEQWAQAGRPSKDFDTLVDAFKHPANLMLPMVASFLLFTILSAFGGAIGARLLDRD
jgi:hypothetical protein